MSSESMLPNDAFRLYYPQLQTLESLIIQNQQEENSEIDLNQSTGKAALKKPCTQQNDEDSLNLSVTNQNPLSTNLVSLLRKFFWKPGKVLTSLAASYHHATVILPAIHAEKQRLEILLSRGSFSPHLDDYLTMNIVGQTGFRGAQMLAPVSRSFRKIATKALSIGLCKIEALSASAGTNHSVICANGAVFTCGGGEIDLQGELKEDPTWLGHGRIEKVPVPTRVAGLVGRNIVGVSAGRTCTIAWTEEGEVYSFGRGKNGNLGHGHTKDESLPRLIEGQLLHKKVVGASAGTSHTVVWTEEGEAYSFGFGYVGSLGHFSTDNYLEPKLIEELVGEKVAGASAGSGHTLFWTMDGKAYSCGDGNGGRLGLPGYDNDDDSICIAPALIDGPLVGKKVIGASAGSEHSLIWTEDGAVYSFGSDGNGVLGHGGEEYLERLPRPIEGPLVGKKVVGVSVGSFHSIVWTEDGEAYSFGCGMRGKLGNGGYGDEEDTMYVPTLVDGALIGKKVIGASAGAQHTLVWTEEGGVFSFGAAEEGQLGQTLAFFSYDACGVISPTLIDRIILTADHDLSTQSPDEQAQALAEMSPHDAASALALFSEEKKTSALARLSPGARAAVLSKMFPVERVVALPSLRPEDAAVLLASLSPADREAELNSRLFKYFLGEHRIDELKGCSVMKESSESTKNGEYIQLCRPSTRKAMKQAITEFT